MRFASNRRWWTGASTGQNYSFEGRWLPLLSVGGLLVALIFAAWRFEPAADDASAAPPPANAATDFQQLPAVRIALRADSSGHLAAIFLNGRPIRDSGELRAQIKAFLGPAADATVEAELDCDANLRYEETQRTIDAISNYPSADGRTRVRLVDRVRFQSRGIAKP